MPSPKIVGNQWEREFAKELSKWLTGSSEKLVVWRNTHSGSLGTKRFNAGLDGSNVDGDIQCLDNQYKDFFNMFYIDTKTFQDCNLLFINKNNQKSNKILNEWIKVCEDASKQNKQPFMPVKIRDGKTPPFIILKQNIVCIGESIKVFINSDLQFQFVMLEEFFTKNIWEEFISIQNF
jgi:hypothetical protein